MVCYCCGMSKYLVSELRSSTYSPGSGADLSPIVEPLLKQTLPPAFGKLTAGMHFESFRFAFLHMFAMKFTQLCNPTAGSKVSLGCRPSVGEVQGLGAISFNGGGEVDDGLVTGVDSESPAFRGTNNDFLQKISLKSIHWWKQVISICDNNIGV